MQFRYSRQAYKPLWLFIILNWAAVMLATKIEGGTPLELFIILCGLCTVTTLIFLAILDIIEWRYPRR